MHFKHFQHALAGLKTKIFGLPPAEQKHSPREIEQLAEAIVEYGRMSQQHYGSRVVLAGVAGRAAAACSDPAVVAWHAVGRAYFGRACSLLVQDGLVFHPAAPAARRQKQRLREARTAVLVIPITFVRYHLRCCFVTVLLLRSTGVP